MKPAFINTNHTSLGLPKGSGYEKPQVDSNKFTGPQQSNDSKKKGPKGGWEDDDDDNQQPKQTSKIPQSYYNRNNPGSNNAPRGNTSTEDADSNKKTDNKKKPTGPVFTVDLEKQLIDNILAPTGITIKPSDNQFKDYLTRAKVLNKENINNHLHSKILSFHEDNDVKGIQKALFVIEFSIVKDLSEIKAYFERNEELFQSIKDYYSDNKKLIDLTNNILLLLGKIKKEEEKKVPVKKDFLKKFKTKEETSKIEAPQNQNQIVAPSSDPFEVFGSSSVEAEMQSNIKQSEEYTSESNKPKSKFTFINKKQQQQQQNVESVFNPLEEIDFTADNNSNNQKNDSQNTSTNINNSDTQPKKSFGFIKKNKENTSNGKLNDLATDLGALSVSDNSSNKPNTTKNANVNDLSDILNLAYSEQKSQQPQPVENNYGSPQFNNLGGYYPQQPEYNQQYGQFPPQSNIPNQPYPPQYMNQGGFIPPNQGYYYPQQQPMYPPQGFSYYPQSTQPNPQVVNSNYNFEQKEKEKDKDSDKLKEKFSFVSDMLKPKN